MNDALGRNNLRNALHPECLAVALIHDVQAGHMIGRHLFFFRDGHLALRFDNRARFGLDRILRKYWRVLKCAGRSLSGP